MAYVELVFTFVLRLYPRDFRRRFGPEMAQVFRTALQNERGQSAARRTAQVAGFVADTLASALRERLFNSFQLTGVAWRELGRQRSFTVTSVIALALGIGGLATAAGIAWQTHFHSYSYREPSQLVKISRTEGTQASTTRIPPDEYLQWTTQATSFHGLGGFKGKRSLSIVNDETVNTPARQYRVTPSLFDVLGRPAALGRLLDTDSGNDTPQVVLAHDFWAEHFDGDSSIVGREVLVDGKPHRVVGVMPEGFWDGADLWTRIPLADDTPQTERPASLVVWARLRDGVTAEQAGRELTEIAASTRKGPAVTYEPFHPTEGRARESALLVILLGLAASIVFLMGAANVRRDHALSMSRRLASRAPERQSVLIALFAAVAGVGISVALLKLALMLNAQDLAPSLRLLGFNTGTAIALAASFALAALLLAWHAKPLSPGSTTGKSRDFAPVMVKTVFAGLCLLGAGVVLRGYEGLAEQMSSSTGRVRWVNVSLFGPAHDSDGEKSSYFHQAKARISGIDGVSGVQVQASRELRLQEDGSFRFRREQTLPFEPDKVVLYSAVGTGPFQTGSPTLVEGRFFQDNESEPVVIVSEAFAQRFFPDGQALGRHLAIAARPDEQQQATTRQVVGVVKLDIPPPALGLTVPPWIFAPFAQEPAANFQLVVSLHEGADPTRSSIRDTLLAITPDQALSEIYPAAGTPIPVKRLQFLVFFVVSWGLIALALLAHDAYTRSRVTAGNLRKDIVLAALGGALLAVSAAYGVRWLILEELNAGRPWEFLGSLTNLSFGASLDPILCLTVLALLTVAASLAGLLGRRAASER